MYCLHTHVRCCYMSMIKLQSWNEMWVEWTCFCMNNYWLFQNFEAEATSSPASIDSCCTGWIVSLVASRENESIVLAVLEDSTLYALVLLADITSTNDPLQSPLSSGCGHCSGELVLALNLLQTVTAVSASSKTASIIVTIVSRVSSFCKLSTTTVTLSKLQLQASINERQLQFSWVLPRYVQHKIVFLHYYGSSGWQTVLYTMEVIPLLNWFLPCQVSWATIVEFISGIH